MSALRLETNILRVTARLQVSGHEIQWDLVGTQLAHGSCLSCGSSVVVQQLDDLVGVTGDAAKTSCVGTIKQECAA
jgi:hypothetical protein